MLAGCVELDYFRSDTLTSAGLATNPAAAVYTTDGVYAMLKDNMVYRGGASGNNSFPRQYFLLNELKGDNICFSWTSTDAFYTSATYKDDAESPDAGYFWMVCYKMIYATNANIAGLVETAAPSEANQLLGENYFLRAFMHFALCDVFAKPYNFGADNPGVVLRIGADSYTTTTRATIEDCYKAIETDLKKAISLMDPSTKRGDNGYATREAAQALLSRLYLYWGKWQDCIDVCDELLGTDPAAHLEDNYTDIYQKSQTSKEVIFCINLLDSDVGSLGTAKGLLGSLYDSPDGTQLTGWGELYVADPLLDLLQRFPGDKRFTQQVRLHRTGGTDSSNNVAPDGLMITWGTLDDVNNCLLQNVTYPSYTLNGAGDAVESVSSSVTDNGDGTYSFIKDGKSYIAKPDNTATKICNDFPGYILNDAANTRCYVRHSLPVPGFDDKGNVTWEGGGMSIRTGGYPSWFTNKFSIKEGASFPLYTSYVLLRYSEVILNRAEAYAHLGGKDAEALADVNTIRTRAGLTGTAQMTAANMAGRGYANVIDAVLDERRMEFFFEGLRIHDLLRNEKDIDRRYPSYVECELIDCKNPKIQYQIPREETSVSGIEPNVRD